MGTAPDAFPAAVPLLPLPAPTGQSLTGLVPAGVMAFASVPLPPGPPPVAAAVLVPA